MGIPYYFATIARTYPGVLHKVKPRACDYYLIDFNGTIHVSARSLLTTHDGEYDDGFERLVYERVWKYTLDCASNLQPSTEVGMYVDGVAPIAKICQQRKRRYLSVLKRHMQGDVTTWDTNAISPGTAFMTRMEAYLQHQARYGSPNGVRMTLSPSSEQGEGEHKLFARVASIPNSSSVYIHGLDADLIMLSLMSHHPNIYLVREPSTPADGDAFTYVDIDRLRCGLLASLRDTHGWDIPDAAHQDAYCDAARRVVETYVVSCFVLGNDFIPHPPALSLRNNGHTRLLRAAKAAWRRWPDGAVTEDGTGVHMPFVAALLAELARDEDDVMWRANRDYLRCRPTESRDESKDAYAVRDENKHPLAAAMYSSPMQRWRQLYYKHLFFTRATDTSVIAHACRDFLTGICWTYSYYRRLPKPFDWCYRHGYAPTLLDLSNHLAATAGEWQKMQDEWRQLYRTPEWLNPTVQLMCILPPESHHLLPAAARECVGSHSGGLAYMYPRPGKYPIQTYMHTHMWECHPVLPAIDFGWVAEMWNDFARK